MVEDKNFDRYGFNLTEKIIFLILLILCISIIILTLYGATKLYYRSDNIALVKNLNDRIVQQELIIKTLSINIAAANATTKSAVDEAQKLLRAHKWVGIFRSVLPGCIDDDWDGGVEENENKGD